MFNRKAHEIRECSINEFNTIIKTILDNDPDRLFINECAHMKDIGPRIYLWSEISKAYLVFNEYSDTITTKCFETDLNDRYADGWLEIIQSTTNYCNSVGKALKFPRVVSDKSEATVRASGIIWSNNKYNKQNTYCYEYDMHLAWLSTFMSCPLPDTRVEPRLNDIVGENEIGFVTNGFGKYNCGDAVVFNGYADYIFPIMYNPNPKYTEKLIKEINEAPTKLHRLSKKSKFNRWLGSMQNKNPYIRVAVIAQSNAKIIELIEKYSDILIYSVTDSLGATERIPELDSIIGNRPGNWSIKSTGYLYLDHYNKLFLDDNGYITNAVIHGVPKAHLVNLNISDYKKLISKVDITKNYYKLDFDRKEIVKNEKRK